MTCSVTDIGRERTRVTRVVWFRSSYQRFDAYSGGGLIVERKVLGDPGAYVVMGGDTDRLVVEGDRAKGLGEPGASIVMGEGTAIGTVMSGRAADGAVCDRRLRTTKMIKPPMTRMATSPPTTPPVMAAALLFLELLALIGPIVAEGTGAGMDVVAASVLVVAVDSELIGPIVAEGTGAEMEVVAASVLAGAVDSGPILSDSAAWGLYLPVIRTFR